MFTMQGAAIPPALAKNVPIPKAVFRITVGNISPEYKNSTANADDAPTFPIVANTTVSH